MPVVRYVALAALVFWLGGTTAALVGDAYRHLTLIAFASGAIVLVALFVMKFVGPPPHDFVPRAAIVAAMLLVSAYGLMFGRSPATLGVTLALGLVLLSWYAHE